MTTLTQEEHRTIDRVTAEVTSRYSAACWWADRRDMVQEAWTECLKAMGQFDPSRGTLAAYLNGVCVHAIRRYLWWESSPCSGGWHRPEEQRTQRRAGLDIPAAEPDGVRLTPVAPLVSHDTPHDVVSQAEWRQRVQVELSRLTQDNDAVAILSEELTPSDLSGVTGLPTSHYYSKVRRLRQTIMFSPQMLDLLREL
jgi:DNA-directed RNA polymerase specialized sigma24 family protein